MDSNLTLPYRLLLGVVNYSMMKNVHRVKGGCLLFVMSAVSPLSGLHSTSGVAFEVLPQSRARGKALGARLTPK